MSDRTKPQHKADKAELRNEDPISGEAGAHPVGVGLGTAVGGAAAGAAAGLAAGPIGTVAGAVIGGVVGGLAGKGIAENIDPTVELDYWKNEYRNRDYFDDKRSFDDYAPAYHAESALTILPHRRIGMRVKLWLVNNTNHLLKIVACYGTTRSARQKMPTVDCNRIDQQVIFQTDLRTKFLSCLTCFQIDRVKHYG